MKVTIKQLRLHYIGNEIAHLLSKYKITYECDMRHKLWPDLKIGGSIVKALENSAEEYFRGQATREELAPLLTLYLSNLDSAQFLNDLDKLQEEYRDTPEIPFIDPGSV